jgi:hypothetical protein
MSKEKEVVLGCEAVDIVTGFEGIVTGRCEYLYGCDQWGLTPKAKDGDTKETRWFDHGRIRLKGPGINPEDVRADEPGAGEAPTIAHGRR